MKVEIDENSGYCFGVEFAIQMAEDEMAEGQELYCLGDIVHNSMDPINKMILNKKENINKVLTINNFNKTLLI